MRLEEGARMDADRPKPRSIFLSHNRADKPFVRRVNRELTTKGIQTWLDEAEILPGESLIDKIQQGLHAMDYLGVFLSPDSVKSNWVRKELNVAITQEIQGATVKVIPIIIGDLRDSDVPLLLSDKYYIDFRGVNPFEKGIHELLMVLSDEYSSYVAKAIKEIESPDEFSTGFAALRALLLEDAEDPEDLAQSLHRYQILKRIGIDLKRFEEDRRAHV